MTEAAKEARRAYKREWARKNAEKTRLYQERFFEKKAAEAAAAQAAADPEPNEALPE